VADEKLPNVPQMEELRKELLEDALRFYESFLRRNQGNEALLLETAKAHTRIARLSFHLGRYGTMAESSRRAVAVLDDLLVKEPTRADLRRELAEAVSSLGTSYHFRDDRSARGKAEAEACFRRSQALLEGLVAEFPGEPDYRYRLAEVLRDSLRLLGIDARIAEAMTIARRSVLLAEGLVAEHPDRRDYRDWLGESHGEVACLLQQLGRDREAVDEFRECFKLLEPTPGAATGPGDPRISIGWFKFHAGQSLQALGRPGEAERMIREAIAVLTADVSDFPRFGGRRGVLGDAKRTLGRLLAETGRPDEAVRMYREALTDLERAVDIEQSRANTWFVLLKCCQELCKLLETAGRLAETEEALRRSVRYADKHQRDSLKYGLPSWTWAVGWRYRDRWALATVLRRRGATAEADEVIHEALALAGEEAHRPGLSPEERTTILRGMVWESTGPEETHLLAEAIAGASPGRAANGDRRAPRADVLRCEAELLRLLATVREGKQVVEILREQERLLKELAADAVATPEDLLSLAMCYAQQERILRAMGQVEPSIAAFGQAVAVTDRLMASLPTGPGSPRGPARLTGRLAWQLNHLAWLLATGPEPGLRDPGRAVELAGKAVELAPSAVNRNTLGVARYRACDWRGAIEALTAAEKQEPGRYLGFNAFFLAMAHGRLGDRPRALRWFDEADRWMRKNAPTDEELVRFRAEAAELLGIKGRVRSESNVGPR
jgi:tetratricopeptide (TPR) repeat protein